MLNTYMYRYNAVIHTYTVKEQTHKNRERREASRSTGALSDVRVSGRGHHRCHRCVKMAADFASWTRAAVRCPRLETRASPLSSFRKDSSGTLLQFSFLSSKISCTNTQYTLVFTDIYKHKSRTTT